jgi:hypothetical protein
MDVLGKEPDTRMFPPYWERQDNNLMLLSLYDYDYLKGNSLEKSLAILLFSITLEVKIK